MHSSLDEHLYEISYTYLILIRSQIWNPVKEFDELDPGFLNIIDVLCKLYFYN
jgi:hypothetical protein